MKWTELSHYWESGEYQVIQEKLSDLSKKKVMWNPGRKNLFRSMDLVPFDKVRVIFVGQDPYPDPKYAIGLAFSIPSTEKSFPPTLSNLLSEYSSDLDYAFPSSGDLTKWCDQGVFLWNAIPSCTAYRSMSHDWPEWELLTQEVISSLSNDERYKVFVFFGGFARRFSSFVNKENADIIEVSHPSPRGSLNAKVPFKGSRLFSSVNDLLCSHGQSAISWRLE